MTRVKKWKAKKARKKYCHLLNQETISDKDLHSLETVEIFTDDPHFVRSIKRCPVCGGYFLYDLHEWVDWSDGNDEIYTTYLPAKSLNHARQMNNGKEHIRNRRPAIHWDMGDVEILRNSPS